MRSISVHELAAVKADGAFVLDVREVHEYLAGHVPGVELIPMGELGSRVDHLPTREPVYVICRSGSRSASVVAALTRAGIDAVNVTGGTSAWESAGYPVVRGAASNVA